MDFLGFTISVWSAIIFGVMFLALVLACTGDRYGNESPKWWISVISLIILGVMYWNDISWRALFNGDVWKNIGIYLAIGLAYSVIEFFIGIRKEERKWKERWENFKANTSPADLYAPGAVIINGIPIKGVESSVSMAAKFIDKNQSNYSYKNRLVNIEIGENNTIVPTINRSELAESIGCWTVWWPAYAVSLVIGDLFVEVCKKLADGMVMMSKQAVNRAFAKTFT